VVERRPESAAPPEPAFVDVSACPLCAAAPCPLDQPLGTYVGVFDRVITARFAYCEACDFAFATAPLDAPSLARYYAAAARYQRDLLTVEEARHIGGQVRFVARYLGRQASPRLLEVGADTGTFLATAVQELGTVGYFDELNPAGQRLLQARGFRDVRDAGDDTRFDVVALRHVLEHIVDPVAYLRQLRARVAADGLVFVEVPDYTNRSLGQADPFQLEHVNYFSLRALETTARRAGYVLVASEITRTPGYSTTPNLVLRAALRPAPAAADGERGTGTWPGLMAATLRDYQAIDAFIAAHPGCRFAFYGAGAKTVEYLTNATAVPAMFLLFDGDPQKIGQHLGGMEIRDPTALASDAFDYVFIMVVGYEREVLELLRSKSVEESKLVFLASSGRMRR
jgi:hypothetical protein